MGKSHWHDHCEKNSIESSGMTLHESSTTVSRSHQLLLAGVLKRKMKNKQNISK